jgi:hypothetical protein
MGVRFWRRWLWWFSRPFDQEAFDQEAFDQEAFDQAPLDEASLDEASQRLPVIEPEWAAERIPAGPTFGSFLRADRGVGGEPAVLPIQEALAQSLGAA